MAENPFHMGPEAILQDRVIAWMTAQLGYKNVLLTCEQPDLVSTALVFCATVLPL